MLLLVVSSRLVLRQQRFRLITTVQKPAVHALARIQSERVLLLP